MKCIFCDEEFKRINVSDTCSLKCKLLKNVKKENQCWLWCGGILKNGYGKLKFNGKSLSVHRVSYELFKGKIPEGLCICHNCPGGDNKACVNPDHLWIGSAKQNSSDAKEKGRYIGKGSTGRTLSEETRRKISQSHADFKGEKSCRSKLKDSDVYEIRELLKENLSLREIGLRYGVSKHAISNIKANRRWSHI